MATSAHAQVWYLHDSIVTIACHPIRLVALTGIGLLSLRVLEALDVHDNKIQCQISDVAGSFGGNVFSSRDVWFCAYRVPQERTVNCEVCVSRKPRVEESRQGAAGVDGTQRSFAECDIVFTFYSRVKAHLPSLRTVQCTLGVIDTPITCVACAAFCHMRADAGWSAQY